MESPPNTPHDDAPKFTPDEDRPRRRLPFAGLGRSGYSNTARDMEEILRREWTRRIYADAFDRDPDEFDPD